MIVPPLDAAVKIALALAIGMMIGFEREWSSKELGVRSFSLAAITGAMAALVSPLLAAVALGGVVVVFALSSVPALRPSAVFEPTTAIALILTYVFGVLVGYGHFFAPIAGAIVATLLLNWKLELHRFADELHPNEIRSGVWLAMFACVIYPLLPDRFIDRWNLVNPRSLWMAIVIVAAIGFVNYILLRLYSARGLLYSAILGGLVNSAATVAQLGSELRDEAANTPDALTECATLALVATGAMVLRNLILLAIFARSALAASFLPLTAMMIFAGVMAAARGFRMKPAESMQLPSPVSMRRVFEFGLIFLVIDVAGALAERSFGQTGFYVVSVLGGLYSSASTTVAAGQLAVAGTLTASEAGIATALASMAGAVANSFIMNRASRSHARGRQLQILTWIMIALGAVAIVLSRWIRF